MHGPGGGFRMAAFGGGVAGHLMASITLMVITVLPEPARTRHSRRFWEGLRCSNNVRSSSCNRTSTVGENTTFSTMQNGDRSRRLIKFNLNNYTAFLRLATPTSPSRPEPNSQTAAGTGKTVWPKPEPGSV
jgi:hypothetical protein